MADYLVSSVGNSEVRIPTKIFHSVEQLKPVLNVTAWQILQLLGSKPMYPAEIAKKLNIHEQKVYYCIKQLRNAGLIEVQKTEERQGALAKYFSSKFDSFAVAPNLQEAGKKKEFSYTRERGKAVPSEVRQFFEPFILNGKLDCKIVVGSTDPHGPFKARARDNHLAVELAAFLASLAEEVNFPLVFLDTMVPSVEAENSNLVIVGGPITNKLTGEINNQLPVRFFSSNGHFVIKSTITGKEYSEDAVGIIEKIQHPRFAKKSILLIAGNRNAGTKAAIIALIKNLKETIKPNLFDKGKSAKVVEGLDLDGDGQIDNAEIKE
ncbi:MAG: S-layer protein [Candidatus Diapherotrites archaeon]|nr:S-layer protein [Candidatus Diapherotrites archaeon]